MHNFFLHKNILIFRRFFNSANRLNYIYSINVMKQKLTLSDGYLFAYRLDIAKDALKKLKDLHKQN